MNTSTPLQNQAATTTISIVSVVDVIGALADNDIDHNLYLLNNLPGSPGQGTLYLQTAVAPGDVLIWTVEALEPEAYASISAIEIDSRFCEPVQQTYAGSDVTYWSGSVKQALTHCPYRLKISLGTRSQPLASSASPALIGRQPA